ncbi:MAG: cell surface protein SprA [Candidatus Delongbacteria bacterium]|nr:cell surface protein SprA [Candidatus Delongbacteria bacterium]
MRFALQIIFLMAILTRILWAWEIRLSEKKNQPFQSLSLISESIPIAKELPVTSQTYMVFKSKDAVTIGVVGDTLGFVPDSILGFYIHKEYLGWETIQSEAVSLEEYQANQERDIWRESIWSQNQNPAYSKAKTSESLFNIEIPMNLPSNIFGSDKVSLQLRGNREISFEGRSETTEGMLQTTTLNNNSNFSLNMDQRYDFSITGKIGTKINVDIQQNSEVVSNLDNSIKINFRGDENDLIQEIDGGNTNLSLPGTQFVGFSAGSSGLFGIRTKLQLGNLQLTTIAAQEKSDREKTTFDVGTGEGAQANTIQPENYIARTYFFLDSVFFKSYPYAVQDKKHKIIPGTIRVFTDNYNSLDNQAAVKCSAYYDIRNGVADAREKYEGYFEEMPRNSYSIDPDDGILTLKNGSLNSSYVLGVIYQTENGDWIGDDTLSFRKDSTKIFHMKLIANNVRNFVYDSLNFTTWDYEMKNAYRIGAGSLDKLRVYDINQTTGGDYVDKQDQTEPFIFIMGLAADASDKTMYSIDDEQLLINIAGGIIRFPDLYPFAPELNRKVAGMRERVDERFNLQRGELRLADKYQVPDLYKSSTITETIRNQIILRIEYTGKATRERVVNLGKTNIASVHITLGSEVLAEGTDYTLMGETGQITFISSKVFDRINEKLTIDYEYEPYFKVGQTTILGTRGEYTVNDNLKFGGTVIYRSERSIDKKPRLGSEPARNTVLDFDASYKFSSDFLTRMLNFLPFFYSDVPSQITVQGEIGHSMPDHNVSKYKAAYIDDFEGSRNSDGLGTQRFNWKKSSPPVAVDASERGKLIWYNRYNPASSREIWPNKEVKQQDDNVIILDLIYLPDSSSILPTATWDGIMRPLWNYDKTQSKYIEIWLKGDDVDLYIDLGLISEDVNGDGGIVRTEDVDGNGILSDKEDIGLWSDPADPYYDPYDDWGKWKEKPDYSLAQLMYINGTKNNKNDGTTGTTPDAEYLNTGQSFDLENDYFEYHVKITKPDPSNPGYYVPGTESDPTDENPWRLYRIPLENYVGKIGNPAWDKIETVRLWISGADQTKYLRIAKFEIVENRWLQNNIKKSNLKTLPDSSLLPAVDSLQEQFRVSVVNVEENSDYTLPEGLERIKDPETEYQQNEQSLSLIVKNLEYGHEASVYQITSTSYDLTMYQTLEFYIHGPLYNNDSMGYFIRLGTDHNNYYQYHGVIANDWIKVQIPIQDMMFFKKDSLFLLEQMREQARIDSNYFMSPEDSIRLANPEFYLNHFYIKGNPLFNNVRRIELGVVNLNKNRSPVGYPEEIQIWFNELRLVDPNNQSGTAKRFSIQTSLANLGSVSYNLTEQDAFFHDLRSDFGKNSFSTTSNYSTQLDIGKFFSTKSQVSIPVSYSHSSSSDVPRTISGSDVILGNDKNDIENDPTLNIYMGKTFSSTFSISYTKGAGSKKRLVNLLFERIKLRYSKSQSDRNDYSYILSRTRNQSGGFSLDLKPKKAKTFKIFRWTKPIPILNSFVQNTEFTPIPSQLDGSMDFTESNSQNQRRYETEPIARVTRTLNSKFNYRVSILNSLPFNYSFDMKRDMKFQPLTLEAIRQGKLGYELSRVHNYSLNYNPKLTAWLTPSANYSYSYNQSQIERTTTTSSTTTSTTKNTYTANINRSYRGSLNFNLLMFMDNSTKRIGMDKFFMWKFLRAALLKRTGPISFSADRTRSYGYAQLPHTPDLNYQLGLQGFDRPTDPMAEDSVYRQRDAMNQSNSWNVGSSFNLIESIRTTGNYKNTVSQNHSGLGSEVIRTSDSWSWTATVGSLNKIFFLKKIPPSLNLNHSGSYSIDNASTGQTKTFSMNPLVGFNTTIKRINLVYSYNQSRSISENAASAETVTKNNGHSVNLSYSFSAERGMGLNFLFFKNKKLKFNNTMNMTMLITLNNSSTQVDGEEATVNRSDLSFKPQISYNFSRTINGGLTGEYTRSNNRVLGHTLVVKALKIFVKITF